MDFWQGLVIYVLWIAFCAQSARVLAMLAAGRGHGRN
jgi:hypothetical protein